MDVSVEGSRDVLHSTGKWVGETLCRMGQEEELKQEDELSPQKYWHWSIATFRL